MANQNKTTLKGYFETGDIPNQNQYGELIDSNLNLVETGIQITSGQISSSALLSETFISASGDISSKGNISSSGLIVGHPNSAYVSASAGSGSAQGNVWVSGTGSFGMIKVSTIQGNSPIIVKDITTFQSTLSASGDLYVSGNVAFTDSTATNVIATGYISGSVISSSGNIKAHGIVEAGDYKLDGVALTTTFTELNYLDGISSAQGGYVIGSNQSVATSTSPTFSSLSLTKTAKSGVGIYGDSVNTGAGKSITFTITGIPTIPGKASGKIQKSSPTLVRNSSTGATDTVIVNCTTAQLSTTVFGQSTAYDALTSGFYISLGNEADTDFTTTSASFTALII